MEQLWPQRADSPARAKLHEDFAGKSSLQDSGALAFVVVDDGVFLIHVPVAKRAAWLLDEFDVAALAPGEKRLHEGMLQLGFNQVPGRASLRFDRGDLARHHLLGELAVVRVRVQLIAA